MLQCLHFIQEHFVIALFMQSSSTPLIYCRLSTYSEGLSHVGSGFRLCVLDCRLLTHAIPRFPLIRIIPYGKCMFHRLAVQLHMHPYLSTSLLQSSLYQTGIRAELLNKSILSDQPVVLKQLLQTDRLGN